MTIETYIQRANSLSQDSNSSNTSNVAESQRQQSQSQHQNRLHSHHHERASHVGAPTTADLNTARTSHSLRAESHTSGTSSNLSSSVSTNQSRSVTPIQNCVKEELREYLDLLNGEVPSDLHRLVMQQVETAMFSFVMEECRGNQSKAAAWLGISRGTLRTRLAALNLR